MGSRNISPLGWDTGKMPMALVADQLARWRDCCGFLRLIRQSWCWLPVPTLSQVWEGPAFRGMCPGTSARVRKELICYSRRGWLQGRRDHPCDGCDKWQRACRVSLAV